MRDSVIIKVGNKSFEIMADSKYFGMTVTQIKISFMKQLKAD